jgi:2-phospho-L-lactate guanylyltransferase
MTQIVVPYRGENGKQRLDTSDEARSQLALAMLGDVLAAATVTGRTLVVTDDKAGRALAAELGAEPVADAPGGQGTAVAAALERLGEGTVLVVNADVPCVVPHDLRTLAGAAELGAIGYVEAEDGTTNALALPAKEHFAPLYGGGSAARFRDHADSLGVPAISCAIPNLSDDVDTLDDLDRIGLRAGPRTQAAIGRALQP